jgi:polysaccharide export outer membrane protein
MRNILNFPEQIALTLKNELYNDTRVGASKSMTHQKQGVFRSLAGLFSGAGIMVLLAAPVLFSQQQNVTTPSKLATTVDANERIAQLAQATSVKQGDYVIGSGDLLGVEVFDVPELSRDVRVNETGFISLPLIPVKVHVTGLTTFQLQDKLAELLQSNGLVSAPQVSVNLKEQHSQPITVIGAVKSPMVIQAIRQTTLLQVLSQAGGISEEAGSTVIVNRPAPSALRSDDAELSKEPGQPQTFTIGLSDLLESGNANFNIPVLGGDVVSVPRAGIIYVVGAVTRPGGFVMANDRDRMTTLKVLSLAGGTTGSAKMKEAVILRKNPDTGKRDEVPVDLKKVMGLKTEDVMLQASDILFVPDSNGKKALHRAGDIAISLTSGVALVSAGRL